jgi:SAM-dependent methyltransferase
MNGRLHEQWEENAHAFSELIRNRGTPHHRFILNPCVEGLLGDVRGRRLLDAGCGEGYLSRFYAAKGAIVMGLDISPKLITAARGLTEDDLDVIYQTGDICRLSEFEAESFDLVLCNLVLLNVSCLEDAMSEFHRVLVPGGDLVFSIVHPAFDFYGPGSWELKSKNPETGRRVGLFFKMDKYFDEIEYERFWKTREGERFPRPFSFFHRTLSTYLNTLLEVGFLLSSFREPRPRERGDFFEREDRIPFFAVFKARKS